MSREGTKPARIIVLVIALAAGAGFILPNDRVDVLLTRRGKDDKGDHFVSETILNNIRILAIDQMIGEKDGPKVVIGRTATLARTVIRPRRCSIVSA